MIYIMAFSPRLRLNARVTGRSAAARRDVEWNNAVVSGAAEEIRMRVKKAGTAAESVFFAGGATGARVKEILSSAQNAENGAPCVFFDRMSANPLDVQVKPESGSSAAVLRGNVLPVPGAALVPLYAYMRKISGGDVVIFPETNDGALSDADISHIFSSVASLSDKILVRSDALTIKTALKYSPYCLITDAAAAGAYFGKRIASEKDVLQSMTLLQKRGAQSVIIFSGNRMYATGDMGGIYRAEANPLPEGAENIATATFASLISAGDDFENALRKAVASVTEENGIKKPSSGGFSVLREPIKARVIRNVAHYVRENAGVTFRKKPLGILDIAVFSQLTMLDLEKLPGKTLTIAEARDKYLEKNPDGYVDLGVIAPQTYPLLSLCADSRRYGGVKIVDRSSLIDDEKVVQFTAITFLLPTGEYCVAFNGTDDSIVGWKEDFYLLYDKPIESQRCAAKYLSRLADEVGDGAEIYVTGHSKGGNLAVYGAVEGGEKLAARLAGVYNFDGPGFTEKFYKTERFAAVKDKIVSVIPQLSVVGRLFNHEERVMIVKSCFAGVYQHDLFSWETEGDGFVTVPKLDELSDKVQAKVNEIMFTLSERQRKVFVDGLFSLLYSTDSFTLTQLMKNRGKLFGNFFRCDAETRRVLLSMTMKLLSDRYVREMIFVSLREAKKMQAKKEFEERSIVSGKIDNAIESIGIPAGGENPDSARK